MFETLTDKLQRAFKNLRGQGKLSEEHLDAGLAEIREALLDGDVNVGVADEFIAHVRAKSLGSEVLLQLSPDQQVVKIVRDELGDLLGKEAKPQYGSKTPAVWLGGGVAGVGQNYFYWKNGEMAGGARAPAFGGFNRRVSSGGARATGAGGESYGRAGVAGNGDGQAAGNCAWGVARSEDVRVRRGAGGYGGPAAYR